MDCGCNSWFRGGVDLMQSPFPGMDPFLEQHWRSVHHRLITYSGDRLQSELPRRYRVEVEERVFVAGDLESQRSVYPDAYVVESAAPPTAETRPSAGQAAIANPVRIELADDPVTETYLEIIDTISGNRVVTAIEFLSPTNKLPGDGAEMYLKKQQEYRAAGVSQVEVDLTRQGDRSLVLPLIRIPPEHRATYLACVRRSWAPRHLEIYPMPLAEPLPTIGVPLDASLPDAPLNLQEIVRDCYINGRYDDLDYTAALQPPLSGEEAAWTEELLRGKP